MQGSKHVVRLNKDKQHKTVGFDSKEPLFNYRKHTIILVINQLNAQNLVLH